MTNKAAAYIYRNLHKNCFSVRFLGKVVEHVSDPIVVVGRFKVNETGRQRVIKEKQKNVHAFIATKSKLLPYCEAEWHGYTKREVTYNPYKNKSFVFADTGEEVNNHIIVLEYPKVYVLIP